MADYTISTANTYNSNNTSSTGYPYFSNQRKNRYTMTSGSWLTGKKIKRAYLSMTISGYYNKDWYVIHACETTGAVSTVFPDKTYDNIVADKIEIPARVNFYPVKTYHFDITEILKYAQKNYSGTWYLWQSFKGGTSDSKRADYPTITIESEIGGSGNVTTYVYNGTTWLPSSPYIFQNGVWTPAIPAICTSTNNFIDGGNWTSATYPTASMGSNNTDLACASSVYDDHSQYYKPVCTLGSNSSYGWMSSNNATKPWIQIHLPHDAYDLTVKIYNSSGNSRANNGPLTGTFYYTDRYNMESVIANLKSTGVTFTRPDGATNSAVTTHSIGNNYPIRNIAIECATWYQKSSSYKFCCIGKLEFSYKYKS